MEVEVDIENYFLDLRRVNLWFRIRGNGLKCKVGMLNFCKDLLVLD